MTDARTPWLKTLHRTPLRDLARFRLTGRLDAEARIAAADVPKPAADLVRRVVKRTRLWRLERADVAAELAAHFADGLAAGESAEALIDRFGDERAAAKLIRRAKRRNRPLAWKVLRVAGWALAAFALCYGLLFARYYAGRPVVSVDYVAAFNAPIKAVPEPDRAWPLYREAMLEIGRPGAGGAITLEDASRLWELKPGDPQWPATAAWLDAHQPAIALVRRAAAKPALGFILGVGGSADDPALFGKMQFQFSYANVPDYLVDRFMMSVMLPHLNGLRELSLMLEADARAARAIGHGRRFAADVDALLGLADQLAARPFAVAQTVGMSARTDALKLINATLADEPAAQLSQPTPRLAAPLAGRVSTSTRPASGAAKRGVETSPKPLLTDAQLRDLARRLAGPRVAADLLNVDGERLSFADAVQRIYTDGGTGGGHVTADGMRVLKLLEFVTGPESDAGGDWSNPVDQAVAAAALRPLVAASRDGLIAAHGRWLDALKAQLRRPLRDAGGDQPDGVLAPLRASAASRAAYAPLLVLTRSFRGPQAMAERYLGRRDGTLVGLALELHRRRHGSYPASLDELAPGLLPSIPLDRITGGPVRYRLIAGRPVVYSAGADRDDDGGRPAVDHIGKPEPWAAARWGVAPPKAPDGDWVLYGPVPN